MRHWFTDAMSLFAVGAADQAAGDRVQNIKQLQLLVGIGATVLGLGGKLAQAVSEDGAEWLDYAADPLLQGGSLILGQVAMETFDTNVLKMADPFLHAGADPNPNNPVPLRPQFAPSPVPPALPIIPPSNTASAVSYQFGAPDYTLEA